MDSGILRAFYFHCQSIGRMNKHFAKKVGKIEALKDSYYAYALDLWNEKDERLKCDLALEIYGWIEEFKELAVREKEMFCCIFCMSCLILV